MSKLEARRALADLLEEATERTAFAAGIRRALTEQLLDSIRAPH
jgi:hypothetical protein